MAARASQVPAHFANASLVSTTRKDKTGLEDLPIEIIEKIFEEIRKSGFRRAIMPASRALLPYYLQVIYHTITLSMEQLYHFMSCVANDLDLLKLIKVLTIIEGDYGRSSYSKMKRLFSHATEVIHLKLSSDDGEAYLHSIEILLDPSNSQNFPHLEYLYIHNPEEDGTLSRNEDVGSIGAFLRSHPFVRVLEITSLRINSENGHRLSNSDFDNIRSLTLIGNEGIVGNHEMLSCFDHLEEFTFGLVKDYELISIIGPQALSVITPSSKKLIRNLKLGDLAHSYLDEEVVPPAFHSYEIESSLGSFTLLQSLSLYFKIIKEDLLYRVIIKDLPSLIELILEDGLRPTTKELEPFAQALRNSKRKFTIQLAPFKNTGVMGKSYETVELFTRYCEKRASAGNIGTKWSIKMYKNWKRPTWTTELTLEDAIEWKRICEDTGLEILPPTIFEAVEIAIAYDKEIKFCSELETYLNRFTYKVPLNYRIFSPISDGGGEKSFTLGSLGNISVTGTDQPMNKIRHFSEELSKEFPHIIEIHCGLIGWELPNWSKSKFEEMTRAASSARARGQALPSRLAQALEIEELHQKELEKLRTEMQLQISNESSLVISNLLRSYKVDGLYYKTVTARIR